MRSVSKYCGSWGPFVWRRDWGGEGDQIVDCNYLKGSYKGSGTKLLVVIDSTKKAEGMFISCDWKLGQDIKIFRHVNRAVLAPATERKGRLCHQGSNSTGSLWAPALLLVGGRAAHLQQCLQPLLLGSLGYRYRKVTQRYSLQELSSDLRVALSSPGLR